MIFLSKWSVFAALVAAILSACEGKNYYADMASRACICQGEFNSSIDYFPDKVQAEHSQLWEVSYHKTYKKVSVKGMRDFYLVLCGAPRSSDIPSNAEVIEIPVSTVSVGSPSLMHHFDFVHQLSSIKHFDGPRSSIGNACMQLLLESGGFTTADTSASLIPNVGLHFVSSDEWISNPATSQVIPVMEAEEKTLLGQIEWIKFVSLFFNRERATRGILDPLLARLDCHANTFRNAGPTKTVLRLTIDIPAEDACKSMESFKAQPVTVLSCNGENSWECDILARAGGMSVIQAENSSNPSIIGEIASVGANADVIVISGDYTKWSPNCTYLLESALSNVRAVVNGDIYDLSMSVNADGRSYFREGVLSEPDLFILDYAQILHPTSFSEQNRNFLRKVMMPNIEVSKTLTAGKCQEITRPYRDWVMHFCSTAGDQSYFEEGRENVGIDDLCTTSIPTSSPNRSAPTAPSSPTAFPTRTAPSSPTAFPTRIPIQSGNETDSNVTDTKNNTASPTFASIKDLAPSSSSMLGVTFVATVFTTFTATILIST